MTAEHKIKAALKVDASQMQLPADLLQRINRQADSLVPVRPGLWSRLRLGPKLELIAACILLVGLLGLATFRNRNAGQVPARGDQGSGIQGTAAETPPPHGLPPASDVIKAYFGGYPGAGERPLDQSVVTKVLEWLKVAPLVGTDKGITFNHGKDFYLVMELRNGETVKVRVAEDCEVTKAPDSTRSTCSRADGQVNLIASASGAPRLRAPEMADWLLGQAAHPAASPSTPVTEGAGDLTLGGMQAIFSAPSSPAKITAAQARETTVTHIGQLPADAKVSVEYVLLTLPGPTVLNGKKMEAYPVYLVTYDGIAVIPIGGPHPTTPGASGNMDTPSTGAQDAKGKVTAFIDANDGEWLMGVAR